jgi:hypothetical protein
MKAKAFLEKINAQAKISNEDFKKSLEAFPDAEIPDVWVNLFEENFLTRDRAAADPKIHNKIRAEVLDAVDEHVKGFTSFMDPKDVEELNKIEDTYKKLKFIKTAVPNVIEKVKKENPDANDQVKELKKNNQELLDKITTINTEREKEKIEINKQFEEKEKAFKLDYLLEKEFSKFTFADEHTKLKDPILKVVASELKATNSLGLGDNGQIVVQEIVNNVAKPKFNGNDPITIDSLLKDKLEPYLKKNNADEGKKTDTSGRKTFEPPKQTGSGTLSELRKVQRTTV